MVSCVLECLPLLRSEFIQMLNQAPLDRAQLAELLNISDTQLSFITNASPGEGLIYDGTVIVPFINKVPQDTAEYEAMTTKPAEVKAREARKEAERQKAAALVQKEQQADDMPALPIVETEYENTDVQED